MTPLVIFLLSVFVLVSISFGLNLAGVYTIPGQCKVCPVCKDCPTCQPCPECKGVNVKASYPYVE